MEDKFPLVRAPWRLACWTPLASQEACRKLSSSSWCLLRMFSLLLHRTAERSYHQDSLRRKSAYWIYVENYVFHQVITSVLFISLNDNICFSTFGVRQPSTKTAGLRHWVMSNISNFGRSEKVNLPQTFPCEKPFEFCSLKLEKKTLIEWFDFLIVGGLAPVNLLGKSLYWCFHCKCLEYTIDYDYVEAFHDV